MEKKEQLLVVAVLQFGHFWRLCAFVRWSLVLVNRPETGCLILSWIAAEWQSLMYSEDWKGGAAAWERDPPHLIRTFGILRNAEIQMFDSWELERHCTCLEWEIRYPSDLRDRVNNVLGSLVSWKQENKVENKIIGGRGRNEKCLVKCSIEIDNLWEGRLDCKNLSEPTI